MTDSETSRQSSSDRSGDKGRYSHRIRTRIEARPPVSYKKRMRKIRVALYVTILIALGMLVTLFLTPIEQTYNAVGHVLPAEDIEIFAPVDALIGEVLIDDGDRVTSGQILMRFELPELEEQILKAAEELGNLQADLTHQQISIVRLEKLPLPKELWEMQDQVEQTKMTEDFYASQLDRIKKLAEEGVASQQEVEKTELQYEQAKIEHNRLLKRLDVIKIEGYTESLMNESKSELQRITVKARGVEERLTFLKNKHDTLSTVKSPATGVVLDVPYQVGQKITRGDRLIYMDTGNKRIVRISGGERNIDRVKVGQKVMLKSEMYDSLFSDYAEGHVLDISGIRSVDELGDTPNSARRSYFIYVGIDKEPQELKIHSTVHAQIILSRRPLFNVLFGTDPRLTR